MGRTTEGGFLKMRTGDLEGSRQVEKEVGQPRWRRAGEGARHASSERTCFLSICSIRGFPGSNLGGFSQQLVRYSSLSFHK